MKHALAPTWLTASELAGMGLPGLPTTTRRVHAYAEDAGWAASVDEDRTPLARRRAARGGGIEYHASLLPAPAQLALRSHHNSGATPTPEADASPSVAEQWACFETRSAKVKAEASRRLSILREVEDRVAVGIGKGAAATAIAALHATSRSVIFDWFKMVAGVPIADRLPFLAPQHKGGQQRVEIDPIAWQIIKSDYMRPEKPSFASCYNRLKEDYADPKGIALPAKKTLERRMDLEVPSSLITMKRDGAEASRRSVPPQKRSVLDLHAMQWVNIDGHTFDVFVQWEDGRIGRPVMVGIQDVFSRKLLAHRIGESECTLLTRLAFADLFRDHGIPTDATLDNGRAFASKALTGGALTRFRFKIKDTDHTGVLTALGIRTHWTLPYRGSSKPIERTWRDYCDDIAKHPEVAGAYTGNKPDAKPENYGSKAIPIAEFREHVARRIAKLNARTGRRTETANGSSFDAAFAESYAVSPVGRASPQQLRLALLVAENRRCNKDNGSVTLGGNVYWSPEMIELKGQVVTVRFDPDNLHGDVHIYSRDDKYLGVAPVLEATGFADKAGAVRRGKLEKDVRKKVRAAEDAAGLLRADQVAELLSDRPSPTPAPEAGVVRPVRHRGNTAAALKPLQQADYEPATPSFSDNFAAAVERRLRIVE